MKEESTAIRSLAESDELDLIADEMAPLRRSVRLVFGAAAVSYLGFLFGPELGEDLGYALFAAAIFALVAGVMSIPWLRKLRQLKGRHAALLLATKSTSETETP